MRKRVLIIGGTGIFGQKLCHHIAQHFDLELFISSRSENSAINFVHKLKRLYPTKPFDYIALDTAKNLIEALDHITPDVTIDCSGPFQSANYSITDAVIAAGSHFIDMADAPGYLDKFTSTLNDAAIAQNVACISGASSSPCFTIAAAKHITPNWQRVDDIDIAFVPGGKGDVGQSVIQAILSYAGKPIFTWREGKRDKVHAWVKSKRMNFGRLGWRRVAPAETYDALYLGEKLNVRSQVSFSAGLESPIEHYGVILLANLSKWGLPINRPFVSKKLASLLHKIRFMIKPFVTGRGGMMIRAKGLNAQGVYQVSEYELIAENNQGPNIPILPTATVLRKLLDENIQSGARLAFDAVSLSEIEAECAGYSIETKILNNYPDIGIYQQHLGAINYQKLPASLMRFHNVDGPTVWHGRADITSGTSIGARIVSKIVGFPPAGKDVPLTVSVNRGINHENVMNEEWTRNFAGKRFASKLSIDHDKTFRERFGALSFEIGLDVVDNVIVMPVKSWAIDTPFGAIPMPLRLAPISQTREFADEQGTFNFDVMVSLPIFGLLAHYRGQLQPAE
ncbi:MAG: DUF4166 domain-containing protein [Lentilitoribacter sp.]